MAIAKQQPWLRRAVAARASLLIVSLVVSVNVATIARTRPLPRASAVYTPRALLSTVWARDATGSSEIAAAAAFRSPGLWNVTDEPLTVRCIAGTGVGAGMRAPDASSSQCEYVARNSTFDTYDNCTALVTEACGASSIVPYLPFHYCTMASLGLEWLSIIVQVRRVPSVQRGGGRGGGCG
jgi:hypothetical protein